MCYTQSEQRTYMQAQIEEMLGEVNRWYAGEALHRPASDSEAVLYYIEHGGAADFRKRWEAAHAQVS
jgi:hypothetical protein